MRSLEDCVGASAGYGILVGDSQAEAVTAVLQRFARSRSQALIAAGGGAGPPLAVPSGLHIPDAGMAGNCVRIRDALAAGLAGGSLAPSFAILVARWQIYGDPASPYSLVGATGGGGTGDLVAGLRRTIESLQRAGVRRILVVGPSPEFQQSAPRCVALSDRAGIDRDLKCSLPRALMDARNARATRWLAEAIAPYGFVRLIDPTDVFCDDRFCRPFAGDDVLYIDTNHLSDAGTRAIRDNAIRDFRWAVPAGAANDGGS